MVTLLLVHKSSSTHTSVSCIGVGGDVGQFNKQLKVAGHQLLEGMCGSEMQNITYT